MQTDQGIGRIVELIRETEQLLRFGFPKSITVETTLPDSVWPVLIGATEFVQVLMNLCVNARDAMPDGGQLSLSVENVTVNPHDAGMYPGVHPGRYVVLNVVDTGVGIPPDILPRIFDTYFTTKGNVGGTGLGLSTTQGILQNHGGLIEVDSEVDVGTRFSVYIPAAASPETTTAEPSVRSGPTGQGELILVIDDEASIREVIKETLDAHNYRVVTAANGAIGLILYRDHVDDIDLVIVDLTTPVMDGQATITAIRNLNPKARIILQSGLASKCSLSPLNPHTADVFLEKPYATDALLQSVHDLLQRK
jgi:CheY-like chemotaxis protein